MLESFHNFFSGVPWISGWAHPIVLGRKAAIDFLQPNLYWWTVHWEYRVRIVMKGWGISWFGGDLACGT